MYQEGIDPGTLPESFNAGEMIVFTGNPLGTGTASFTHTVSGLTAGTTYDFVLDLSTNLDDGEFAVTGQFTPASITTTGGTPPVAPAAPADLGAVNLGDGVNQDRVELIWQNTSNVEDGFIVQESAHSNFSSGVSEYRVGADVTNFIGTEPVSRKTVYYRVAAYRGNAQSSWVDTSETLTQYPAAVAISWIPIMNPENGYIQGFFLGLVPNSPPPTDLLSAGTPLADYIAGKDYRNVLTLKVGYAVDPYSGAFTVTPYGVQYGGYTDPPGPGGTLYIAGETSTHGPSANYNSDDTQAEVFFSGLFRISALEQPFVAYVNQLATDRCTGQRGRGQASVIPLTTQDMLAYRFMEAPCRIKPITSTGSRSAAIT
jgi:hypothetical protein